jgi:hypothetical protein
MDNSLLITLGILAAALVAFLTEKIPADLVALLVAVALGLTGVLTPDEAFSGFSRAAVIIIIAIFILAEALKRTGVTEKVGSFLLKAGGGGEHPSELDPGGQWLGGVLDHGVHVGGDPGGGSGNNLYGGVRAEAARGRIDA